MNHTHKLTFLELLAEPGPGTNLAMFCIDAKEVVEDSRHGIMIRCNDAAREREKVNATGIEVG